MANKRQQDLNNQNSDKTEKDELLEKAKASREKAEAALKEPDFAKDAAVDAEVVDEGDSVVDTTTKPKVEAKDLPKSVQTNVKEQAASEKVNFAELQTKVSSSGLAVLETIKKYMVDMKPGKVMNDADGARHQAALYNALYAMFNNLNDSDFNLVYRAVLDLFAEHSEGVFDQIMLYRFAPNWTMGDAGNNAYRRWINMMVVTADAKTRRQSLKELTNWEYILEYGLTDNARNRIRNFYEL